MPSAVTCTAPRRIALVAAFALFAALAFAAHAQAVSGTAVQVGEPSSNEPPAVAVDSAGTAYVAWADTTRANEATVQYCVIPAGASACTHSGTLVPAGASASRYIDRVQVLLDGTTVVVLADVYGVAEEYVPEQEWQSSNGGATFSLVNEGKSVAEGIINADTGPVGAVIVPGTGELGYAWITADGPPTFAAFPLSSPPECSVEKGHTCTFATLQSEEPFLGNLGGVIASQLGTHPGVLGVYPTLGKPGCASGTFDTAYVYGSGLQSASNNYNEDPGAAHSAWKVGLAPGDCEVDYPAVAGGPSGFGVFEDDLLTKAAVYHPFDQTHEDFDTGFVPVAPEGEEEPSLSQDAAGGIYAVFLGGGVGGPIRLAYSSSAGSSWTGPATLNPDADSTESNLTSSVGPTGQGWAVWTDNGLVFAQQFDAADATPPPAPAPKTETPSPSPPAAVSALTIPKQNDAVGGKGGLSVVVDCSGALCTGTMTLVAKAKKTTGKGKKKKTKTVIETIAATSFSSLPLGTDTVALKLNATGLSLLAHDGYKLHASASATYASGKTFLVATGELALKGHKPKAKKKKKK